jgi:uncharacterized protein DUF4389
MGQASVIDEHPVKLLIEDDLRRNRLTVFFRLLLAIPHFIWLALWSIAAFLAAVLAWIFALAGGRVPDALHSFLAAYVRYTTHLTAYLSLVANPYPGFAGDAGLYPVDVALPGPEPQLRWRTLLRLVLAIPALVLAGVLGGFGSAGSSRGGQGSGETAGSTVTGLLLGIAFLGWFASLFTGRMPRGLRDAGAYATGYRAQTLAYLLLVTERYPSSDPTAMLDAVDPPAPHVVRLVGDADDLRRSRLTVLFRLPLAIPHIVWLVLWGVVAWLAAIVQWFVTLFRGRPAASLHAFLSHYVRYSFHVYAFVFLAANPFPGFTGDQGRYPLDLELPGPARQNRWKTGFRLLLAVPGIIVDSALSGALIVAAVLMWFVALATGTAPWGLRNLVAYAIRYAGQLNAYLLFVTDAYPFASPLEGRADTQLELV